MPIQLAADRAHVAHVRRSLPRLPVARNGLARAVAARRLRDGLTVRAAANQARISYSSLQRLEVKDKMPSVETFVAVARWLGFTLDSAGELLLDREVIRSSRRRRPRIPRTRQGR
jgi:transcriptional regulator with XRE-family HTH domain